MNWENITERMKYSILYIIGSSKESSSITKENPPINVDHQIIYRSKGIGFIVDINNGFIITTAHTIKNAYEIMGYYSLMWDHPFKLSVRSKCPKRDLALLQLQREDIQLLLSILPGENCGLIIGDSLEVHHDDEVLIISISPSSSSSFMVKSKLGNVVRISPHPFSQNDPESSFCFVIDMEIERGHSGSPVLNSHGEVIGIIVIGEFWDKNSGYALTSRSIMSIYHALLFQPIVNIPRFSIGFNKKKDDGWQISHRGTDSIFPSLIPGDYLVSLTVDNPENYLVGYFGVSGIQLEYFENIFYQYHRYLEFGEFLDLISYDAEITLEIRRRNRVFSLYGRYSVP